MFPGDEVNDQVSVQGPLYFSCLALCDPDGRRGGKTGRGVGGWGQREIKKAVFHLKNERMLHTHRKDPREPQNRMRQQRAPSSV